ncbi:sensor histidine kinase [Anaeromyxobacter dehalogenans]|uniref:histidine kinase n=1 Tax=Anaeromyxobacter dehalogenans (strain 2CP-C) TaxID=290397 RepID=Q2IMW1_ANADE|nr:ATP-binding protein [Anaeromyxobacter dehalogenans]ABC80143.1 multi-sensor signal transduction histidine kinase [Anaeromyxobacter dehalogenans 2CP-C]
MRRLLRIPPPPALRPAVAYGLAVALPVACTFALLAAPGVLRARFVPMLPAVLLAAWLGGAGPGVVATLLSALGVNLSVMGPATGWAPGGRELAATPAFLMVATLLVLACAAIRTGYAERAARERAVRESEARFRTLVETIPQLVFTLAPDGRPDFHSPQFEAYTGLDNEAILAAGWAAQFHPDDRARARADWEAGFAAGRAVSGEYRLRGRDGGHRWFLVSAVPLRDAGGRVVKWFGTFTDIEAQKEVERRKSEAIAARDVFLSVASHELKTPVTAALLQAQQALRSLDRDPADARRARGQLAAAAASVERLGRLVEALLDVSRLATGRAALERRRYDLSDAVRQAAARLAEAAARVGSALELDVEPGLACEGDRLRIEQVLTNLASNALKYGAGRPITIGLRREGGRAVLRVRDRGIGIPPADLERIFGRFERAHEARHYGGLGLGLWIAREIVEGSGGTICAESAPGEGATFTVSLPLAPPAAQAAAAPGGAGVSPAAPAPPRAP